jgi:hypothetical protein
MVSLQALLLDTEPLLAMELLLAMAPLQEGMVAAMKAKSAAKK